MVCMNEVFDSVYLSVLLTHIFQAHNRQNIKLNVNLNAKNFGSWSCRTLMKRLNNF